MNDKLISTFRRNNFVIVDFDRNLNREKTRIRPAIVGYFNQIDNIIIIIPVTKYGNKIKSKKLNY